MSLVVSFQKIVNNIPTKILSKSSLCRVNLLPYQENKVYFMLHPIKFTE